MHFILNLTTQATYSSAGTTSRTIRLRRSQRFATKEEAMEHFRHQYRISTAEQEEIVRDHLGRVLIEENGGFGLPASSIRVKIWWETGSEEDGLAES
jgi:hypothetical protein